MDLTALTKNNKDLKVEGFLDLNFSYCSDCHYLLLLPSLDSGDLNSYPISFASSAAFLGGRDSRF